MLVFDTEHQGGNGAPVEAEIRKGLADKLQSPRRDLADTRDPLAKAREHAAEPIEKSAQYLRDGSRSRIS